MSDGGLDLIKQDMLFYLEKTFQFSFVYVGAVFAVLAGAKYSVVNKLACSFNITHAELIVPASILLLNLLYLTLATSCAHAILKRAYFMLDYRNATSVRDKVLTKWEQFTRRPAWGFNRRTWNVDNYFSGALYLTVLFLSIGLWVDCLKGGWGFRLYAVFIFVLHVVLFKLAVLPTLRLGKLCHAQATRTARGV